VALTYIVLYIYTHTHTHIYIYMCKYIQVKLKVSHLLGRHSTSWVTLPALFAVIIFEICSHLSLGHSLPIVLPIEADVTGMCYSNQPLVEMRVLWTFCPVWPQTTGSIPASQVARITGLSHLTQSLLFVYILKILWVQQTLSWEFGLLSILSEHKYTRFSYRTAILTAILYGMLVLIIL
jgi:hypothetical protein